MKCEDCKWWQRDRDRVTYHSGKTPDTFEQRCTGDCRKKRPVIAMATKDISGDFERYSTIVSRPVTRWPRTTESEWCGEFELKDTPHE